MKLSPWVIYVLGLAVAVIAISYGLFQHLLPNSAETRMYNDRNQELVNVINQAPQAQKRVDTALALVKAEDARWRQVVAARTPEPTKERGGISLAVNPWQLSVDVQSFRNNVQRAVNRQLVAGGVKIVSAPSVPGVPVTTPANQILSTYFNFPALGFPVVIFDLGQVTVEGSYEQIGANVRAWKSMPRYLATISDLALTGTDNKFTATYNVSIVGFIRGDKIFPNVPEDAATATGGMGGSLAGGRPGPGMMPGAPGGPGMGRPGPSMMPGSPGGPGMGRPGPAGMPGRPGPAGPGGR